MKSHSVKEKTAADGPRFQQLETAVLLRRVLYDFTGGPSWLSSSPSWPAFWLLSFLRASSWLSFWPASLWLFSWLLVFSWLVLSFWPLASWGPRRLERGVWV